MKDPSRANDGERHVPTAASEDGGALGEAAMVVATGSRHSLAYLGEARFVMRRMKFYHYSN
jgi:hypothetical protein